VVTGKGEPKKAAEVDFDGDEELMEDEEDE